MNEYSPEIGTIVPRVVNAQSTEEITGVLYEEFVRWFGDGAADRRQVYEAARRSGELDSNSDNAPDTGVGFRLPTTASR